MDDLNINSNVLKIFLLTLIGSIVTQYSLYAQKGNRENSKVIGRIYGKVVDSKSAKPVSGALVQITSQVSDSIGKKNKTIIIATQATERNGDFAFENITGSSFLGIRISLGNYQNIEKPLQQFIKLPQTGGNVSAFQTDIDLGNVKLIPLEASEVLVVSNKALFQLGADRKIFNVDKNNMSTGGTAIDVLRNVPSVQVDIDGNVQLRSNPPQIFVDGRPTTLTFDQIPADAIASVELITNPSAKFDASGGNGGIINIVLKKNKKKGYSGNLRAGIDSRAKVNSGLDINIRRNKVNYFASANLNQRKTIAQGESERINIFDNPIKTITQTSDNIATGYFANLRGGMDVLIDNRNTLTISGRYTRGAIKPKEESITTNDSAFYVLLLRKPGTFNRNGNTENNFWNRGGSLAYKRNFSKTGQELTIDVDYNRITNSSDNTLKTIFANSIANTVQQVNVKGSNELLVAQADYVHPIKKLAKLEAGMRYQVRNIISDNVNTVDGVIITALGYNYKNSEAVYAAYASYTNVFNKIGYALGLRMESSSLTGELKNTQQNFSTKYPFSFFPSVSFNYKINEKQDLQFSYSRRISRPTFFQLLPFIDFTDSLNITSGNPALRPEFANSIEASYNISLPKGNSILVTLYSKISNGLVSRYQYKTTSPFNNQEVLVNGWINANTSSTSGIEFVAKTMLNKQWEVLSNVNVYISTLTLTQNNITENNNRTSYFIKQNHTYKLPKNWAIQLALDFQSKTILPPGNNSSNAGGGRGGPPFLQPVTSSTQGFIRPTYGLDIALRKDFGKTKNISATLNVSDVFKTRINDIYTETVFFTQNYYRRRDWRLVRLNLSYRFGKQDANLFKRKNNKSISEGGE
jgi:outer membrane receptor protein involved in Fe transport